MNSDKEKEIFEGWGWEYDFVQRHWKAPDGYTIGIEDLMGAADEYGSDMEMAIIDVARRHGSRQGR